MPRYILEFKISEFPRSKNEEEIQQRQTLRESEFNAAYSKFISWKHEHALDLLQTWRVYPTFNYLEIYSLEADLEKIKAFPELKSILEETGPTPMEV